MNKFNLHIHQRRSVRLKDYDYSQAGGYFVTVCSYQKECKFGLVKEGRMQLNNVGEIIKKNWERIPKYFKNVELDEFVIMPNHLHGLIFILSSHCRGEAFAFQYQTNVSNSRANASPLQALHGTQAGSLGAILQNFKSVTTRKVNVVQNTKGTSLWQRNYHEHVIRNDQSLENIRKYILNNPLQWDFDPENPFYLKDSNIFGRPNRSFIQKEQAFI